MKKSLFGRIASAILAGAVAMTALVTTAFAAGEYSIEVKGDAVTDKSTFKAYQVFEGTVNSDGSITVTDWGSGVDEDGLLDALKSASFTGATFTGNESATEVAQILADDSFTEADAKLFADIVGQNLDSSTGTGTAAAGSYKIELDQPGYYLVKDETNTGATGANNPAYVFSDHILRVAGTAEVNVKSDVPTVTKKITGVTGTGAASTSGKTANASIGDTVAFEITGTLPGSYYADYKTYKYIFTDTPSDGLAIDEDSVEVYVDNAGTQVKITGGYVADVDADGVLTVTFADLKSTSVTFASTAAISGTSKIVVKYNATVTKDAEVGTTGNDNSAKITYSNDPNSKADGEPGEPSDETGDSVEVETTVYTYQINVNKNDGNSTPNPVVGAEFVVTRNGGTEIAVFDANGKLLGWLELDGVTIGDFDNIDDLDEEFTFEGDLEGGTVGITTNDQGNFSVAGLGAGTYTFTEISAPDGYDLLKGPFTVTLTADTDANEFTGELDDADVSGTAGDDVDGDVNSTNAAIADVVAIDPPQSNLPETGGSGVYFYYIVGGALVLLAGAALFLTKKKSNKNS